jgi:hypothetical protein
MLLLIEIVRRRWQGHHRDGTIRARPTCCAHAEATHALASVGALVDAKGAHDDLTHPAATIFVACTAWVTLRSRHTERAGRRRPVAPCERGSIGRMRLLPTLQLTFGCLMPEVKELLKTTLRDRAPKPGRCRVGPAPELVRLNHSEVSPPRGSPLCQLLDPTPLAHEHVPVRVGGSRAARAPVGAQVTLARTARHEPCPFMAVAPDALVTRVIAQLRHQLIAVVAAVAMPAHALPKELIAPTAATAATQAAAAMIVCRPTTSAPHCQGRRHAATGGQGELLAQCRCKGVEVGRRRQRMPHLRAKQQQIGRRRARRDPSGLVVRHLVAVRPHRHTHVHRRPCVSRNQGLKGRQQEKCKRRKSGQQETRRHHAGSAVNVNDRRDNWCLYPVPPRRVPGGRDTPPHRTPRVNC